MSSVQRRHLWVRRLHSLAGVAPVGLFLAVHLWTGARALQGQAAFEAAVGAVATAPHLLLLEVLAIHAPLFVYAAVEMKRLLGKRAASGLDRLASPLLRARASGSDAAGLQAIGALLVLAFAAHHLWHMRLKVALGHMKASDVLPELCRVLSTTSSWGAPIAALLHLAGLAAAAYLFASGLSRCCVEWGLARSPGGRRALSAASAVTGVLLFAAGANGVIHLATGSPIFHH